MKQYNQFNLIQNSYFNQSCNADKKEPQQGSLLVLYLMNATLSANAKTAYKLAYHQIRFDSLICETSRRGVTL